MENQHRLIKGYNELSKQDIDLINLIKSKETELLELIRQIEPSVEGESQRWLATGKTDLQKGFMSVIRAIAKPNA